MTLTAPVLAPEDLAAIATDVWAAFLSAEGVHALLEGPPGPTYDDTVHATVAVTGAWVGRIALTLPPEAADLAAATMLGVTDAEAADVADAVGELANMVGGNVKSLVPAPSTLGLPSVGRGPVPTHSAETEECAVDLVWLGHPVRVTVWSA